ncbi:MAG TPA: fumarylacetoacetate hydrolase family protein [Pseudolabrys sp.]|nr:fumarylacetoacetate hydrolase family protein [Pseudolabrys sp.]
MNSTTASADVQAIADEVLSSLAAHRQAAPFSARPGGLTLDAAYRVTPLLRAAFEARGETVLGRKIGFTNRSIWPQYGVYAPIWGYVTDATVHDLSSPKAEGGEGRMAAIRTADFAEPRIEPEIMFGLRATPAPDMGEDALLDCIDWVALGYEIVQSIFPAWKFAAADTVAVNGLHGALCVGPRHAIAPRRAQWLGELATFTAELSCNGRLVDRGGGAAVLDSPLSALRHLVGMLAKDRHNPPLAAGEIISTGTLTKAMPVAAGETWTTRVAGIPLEDAVLRFC